MSRPPTTDSSAAYRESEAAFYQDLLAERHEAFEYLYQQTYQLCMPYALSRGSKQEEAEDLLQECLAIFVQKLRGGTYTFQEGARISTYFYRVYSNQWKKMFEQRTRRGEVPLLPEDAEESEGEEPYRTTTTASPFVAILRTEEGTERAIALSEAELSDYDDDERAWIFQKLNRSFQLLSDDCQKVLQWFYVEEWSLRQIAGALGMTEASATVKRFKCAKYLKEKFRLL
jgi:RNA polymerase sigma factor (sigma-70 family)